MPVSVTTYDPYVEMPDSISSRPVPMTSRDSLDTTPTRTDTVASPPADTLTGTGTPAGSTPPAAATRPLPAGDNPSAQIATPLTADTTATSPQPLTQAGDDTTPPLVAPLPADTTQTVLDTVGTVADTVTGQEYIPTIPLREGLPGRERTGNAPLHDDTFFALLLAGLVVFLLFIRHRKRILSWQSDGKTEHYRDSNRSKHLLGINAHLRNLFLAYTFLVEGALGAIALFVVGQPLPLSGGYAVNTLLLALPAALYFLLQQGIFVLLAAIFSSDARGREWCDTHLIINLLLGIGLFPFAFVATYLPEAAQTCLICAIILYLLTRILFIIKGVKLFLRDFRYLLYFILYLCALEIAPLLLAGKSWGIL